VRSHTSIAHIPQSIENPRRSEDDRAELNMKVIEVLKESGDEDGSKALIGFIMSGFFKDTQEGDLTIESAGDGGAAHNEL
jgi:hypothetical protein